MLHRNRPVTRLTYLNLRIYSSQFSLDGSRIVFSASGNHRSDVYAMNTDGSGLKCLTTSEGQFWDARFSPNGQRIVFVRAHPIYEERHDVWIMDADGANPQALTSDERSRSPVFSPDGKSIAFVSYRNRAVDIYRMNLDGTEQMRLTYVEDTPDLRVGPTPKNSDPVFHPHGNWLYYLSRRLGPSPHPEHGGKLVIGPMQLWRIRPDGSGPQRVIADTDVDCDEPIFDRTGDRIAFYGRKQGNDQKSVLMVANPDGSRLATLPDTHGSWPAFHLDGPQIAFASCRDRKAKAVKDNWDLYVVNAANGEWERLTDNTAFDGCPIFHPDGAFLIFCSDRDGKQELYRMEYA